MTTERKEPWYQRITIRIDFGQIVLAAAVLYWMHERGFKIVLNANFLTGEHATVNNFNAPTIVGAEVIPKPSR